MTPVSTVGLIIGMPVTAASVQDRGGMLCCPPACLPHLILIRADSAYTGRLAARVREDFKIILETVRRNGDAGGFEVLPRRRVAERTFGRFGRCRRMSKDCERRTETGQAFIYIAMIEIMLRR